MIPSSPPALPLVRTTYNIALGVTASLMLSACFDVGPSSSSPEATDGSSDASTGEPDDQSTGSPEPPGTTTTDEPSEDTTGSPVDPGCTSTDAGVTIVEPTEPVAEGEDALAYTVVLDSPPCAVVQIAALGDAQLELDAILEFGPDDWDAPQPLDVVAIHDFEREGDHEGTIAYTVSSEDPEFDGLPVPSTTIAVLDRAHLAHVSVPLYGTGTDADSLLPRVSDDGQWVAFLSDASNLDPADTGAHRNAFRRDMAAGTTERLTTGLNGAANGDTGHIDMSADGSMVALASEATNLVPGGSAGQEIYLWAEPDGLVALSAPCDGCDNEVQGWVSMSDDGQYVTYSTRRQMMLSDNDTEHDVYTVHLPTHAVTHDSLNAEGENGTVFWTANAFAAYLSADGQFVGFGTPAQNLDFPDIEVQNFHSYVKNRLSGEITRVTRHDGGLLNCDGVHRSTISTSPLPSSDGNVAVFSSGCDFQLAPGQTIDQAGLVDVFVRDIGAQATTRISVGHDGTEADGESWVIDISDDARFILFWSDATNLVPDDTNGVTDLFVHDRQDGSTVRVSHDIAYGELLIGADTDASLSADGQWVVFSTRDALLPSDGNEFLHDLYRVQLY